MSIELIIGLLYALTIGAIILIVVTNNGEPIKTVSWILVLLLIPIGGLIIYFFLGNNLRRNKFLNRKEYIDSLSSVNLNKDEAFAETDKQKLFKNNPDEFTINLLSNNSQSDITTNNQIELLVNGDKIYSKLIDTISKAEKHIHLDFFRIQPGEIWEKILNILLNKAKEGVAVRIIYDDVGSWKIKRSYAKKLRRNKIDIKPFMPIFLPRFANKVNYRNHRKIVVVDGKTAIIGGFNIADYYVYGTKKLGDWHDIAIRITGDAVHSVQKVFLIDWSFVNQNVFKITPDIFPESEECGNTNVQIVKSGPDSDWSTIMQSYFSAIASSKKYVYLSTPYFLPNESILTALKTASLSGRKVKLLLPHKGDQRIVNLATQSYINELLEAGIETYLFHQGFNHGKYIIVDGRMCSIGTANIDIRSFDHDFEINAFIYDEKLATKLKDIFINYTKQSYFLTKESWNRRPKIIKLGNSFARLLSPMF